MEDEPVDSVRDTHTASAARGNLAGTKDEHHHAANALQEERLAGGGDGAATAAGSDTIASNTTSSTDDAAGAESVSLSPRSSATAAVTATAAAATGRRPSSPFVRQGQQGHAHSSSPRATSPTQQSPGATISGAGFVAPSSYLRPLVVSRSSSQEKKQGEFAIAAARPGSGSVGGGDMGGPVGQRVRHPLDKEQTDGLRAIRAFLKVRTTYDVLPLSYRLIVLDTAILVKKSLNILNQCGIVSAPLWDSKTSTFAGLLTTSDYLNVVQYYWQNPDMLTQIDQFKLNSLREIERALGVTPIETVSIHPLKTLYEACRRMLESRARRIPLVDIDDETNREMVVSVLTQYRILKFVSVNVKETQMLRKPLRDLNIGSYENLSYAYMDSPVMEVIQALVRRSISSVPILDREGAVLNVFEAVDVIALIKGGDYDNLQLTVGKALEKRSEDFPGIYTCTLNDRLDTIFDTIRKSRVHRLVIIDERSQLVGLLSLSDILDYTLNSPLEDGEVV